MSRKKQILVVYHWRRKRERGVGNVDCTVDGDIIMSSIRDMERQIREKFNFDNVVILNIIDLAEESEDTE